MSLGEAVSSGTLRSQIGGHRVRVVDALFVVSVFGSTAHTSTHTGTICEVECAEDDVMEVMRDHRIVRVSGWWVHSDVFGKVLSFLPGSIRGVHVKTIPIVSDYCVGMSVNPSETLMAVTCSAVNENGDKLYLYSLPGGELLRTVGESGDGRGEFLWPQRVCFGPDDTIVVAGNGNNRLQEFSSTGEYKRTIAIPVDVPIAVSMSHDGRVIGVGTAGSEEVPGSMLLLDYGSGIVLRLIGEGYINGSVSCVCFTPNDAHVIVTTWADCASMFAVGDGSFVRSLCHGLSPGGWDHDIVIADNGDIVVADEKQQCILVYNSDGSKLLRSWGSEGSCDGEFVSPTALSCVHGRLYVLDWSPRVQVFE